MKLLHVVIPVCTLFLNGVSSGQVVIAPTLLKIGSQTMEIVPAFERQMDYVSAVQQGNVGNDLNQLYSKLVSGPVFERCGTGGEYSDLGRLSIARAPTDLDSLGREIDTLRKSVLNIVLEEGLRKAAGMLAGPDTTVCVLAADPAAGYIKTDLHGVSGVTIGAGKIWLLVNPERGWESWARYTIVHEYHHSAWTARYYQKSAPDDLLNYLVFEGRADSFAHSAYPTFDVPWNHALTHEREAQAWRSMREVLATTDFRTKRTMMFGDDEIPHWAGYTIGFDIVESYRKQHPEESTASWTAAKPQVLLDGSDFAGGLKQ